MSLTRYWVFNEVSWCGKRDSQQQAVTEMSMKLER